MTHVKELRSGRLRVGDYLGTLVDNREQSDAEYKIAADAINAGVIQKPSAENPSEFTDLYNNIREFVKDKPIRYDLKSILDAKLTGGFTRDEMVVLGAFGTEHPSRSYLGLEAIDHKAVSTHIDAEAPVTESDKMLNLIIQKGGEYGKTLMHFDAALKLYSDAESEGNEMMPEMISRDFVSSTMAILKHHDNPDPREKVGWKYPVGGEVCCNVNLPKKRKERKAKAKLAHKSKVKNRK